MYFPAQLVRLGEKKAKRLGFTLTEYLHYLLAKDIKEDLENISYVDEKTEKEIGLALQDHKAGKTVTLSDNDDIKKYFDSLVE